MPHRATRVHGLLALLLLGASALYLAVLLYGYIFATGGVRRHHVEAASYIFVAAAAWTAFTRRRTPAVERAFEPLRQPGVAIHAAAVAVALIVYGRTLGLGLFSDDFVLAERALAGGLTVQDEFVRPVPLVLWRLLLTLTGTPAALHLLNIVLHGLNAALVFHLGRRAGLTGAGAAIAAGLFVAFPGTVEAVVWPAAVPDLLATSCTLGFLILATHRADSAGMIALAALVALGLLSKESAVVAPVLAAVLWLRRRDEREVARWRAVLVAVAVCAAYVALRAAFVQLPEDYARPPTRYLLKELVARTYGTLALPWSAEILAGSPALVYLWVLTVVAAAVCYAGRETRRIPASTIVRFASAALVSVLPVYSMFFVTANLENSRYLYLASAFWTLAVAGLVDRPRARWMAAAGAAAVTVAAAGVQWHFRPWREAAAMRDRVLVSAGEVIASSACPVISFAGAPDSVGGAFVFRNGLAEALAAKTAAIADGGRGCLFVWDGSGFQRSDETGEPIQATLRR